MPTYASLFSGFGLADIGAKQAGCDLLWGVELDPDIAEVSKQLGHQVINQSVLDVDYSRLERPDILWASPPCPNFSIAKKDRVETKFDIDLANAVINAITTLQPKAFILENVEGYKNSKSLKMIEDALFVQGYWINREVLNAADFGVPQTRRRLILRAIKGGFVPPLPQKQEWVGWYQAVEDLMPSLPETKLAQWQLDRLNAAKLKDQGVDLPAWVGGANCSKQFLEFAIANRPTIPGIRSFDQPVPTVPADMATNLKARAILVESKNANQQYGDGLRYEQEPATTVVTDHKPSHAPKAILVPGGNASSFATRDDHEPSPAVGDTNRVGNRPRALLPQSVKVVQMTSRCLARFQTLPDWYELPENNKLACKGIGNGVPCKLAEVILRNIAIGI